MDIKKIISGVLALSMLAIGSPAWAAGGSSGAGGKGGGGGLRTIAINAVVQKNEVLSKVMDDFNYQVSQAGWFDTLSSVMERVAEDGKKGKY